MAQTRIRLAFLAGSFRSMMLRVHAGHRASKKEVISGDPIIRLVLGVVNARPMAKMII